MVGSAGATPPSSGSPPFGAHDPPSLAGGVVIFAPPAGAFAVTGVHPAPETLCGFAVQLVSEYTVTAPPAHCTSFGGSHVHAAHARSSFTDAW